MPGNIKRMYSLLTSRIESLGETTIAEVHDDPCAAAEEALAHEPAAARDIVMGHAAHDLFRADAVGVVGVGRGLAARGDGGQLSS